jgi:lipopolysaccharide export system permease protein
MIFFELVRVFLVSLLGITGVLVTGGVVAEASKQGLNPAQILRILPLLVPNTLPYTIPATTLFATCVVYGRLAHDNEILAIAAAGIHLGSVVGPAVFLGVAMSSVTLGLYYHLIPHTHSLLLSCFQTEAEEYLDRLLRTDRCIKMANSPYAIWARRVQGKHLVGALFKRRPPGSANYDVIAQAREAVLHVDLPNQQILVHMRHGYVLVEQGRNRGYFEERTWEVPLPPSFGLPKERKPRGMSFPDLWECRRKLTADLADNAQKMTTLAARPLTLSIPNLPGPLDDLRAAQRQLQDELRNVSTEFHMRPVLSLSCLCFVLVGCPVGIWFGRSDFLSAFITCFLPIVFLYYPVLLCAGTYARQGKLPPAVALWTGNVLLGLIALALFRRLPKL